jgi:5-methyltetrahydropteroyltriglutamate--homocysteine methyltransferase
MSGTYRADQVGSFLRPAELLQARRTAAPGVLAEMENRHILRVLAKQKELGFDIFTDGRWKGSIWEIPWRAHGRQEKRRTLMPAA